MFTWGKRQKCKSKEGAGGSEGMRFLREKRTNGKPFLRSLREGGGRGNKPVSGKKKLGPSDAMLLLSPERFFIFWPAAKE